MFYLHPLDDMAMLTRAIVDHLLTQNIQVTEQRLDLRAQLVG
jgi:hypothetical protein